MEEKTTGDLSRELMDSPDIDSYLTEHQDCFFQQDIAGLLQALFEKKKLTKAALARRAGMSEVYLHQIFSGRRTPSRDRLLCLCIGMEGELDEVQNLLKQAGCGPLHPKVRRDAIISYGLLHRLTLSEINDILFEKNEKTLA